MNFIKKAANAIKEAGYVLITAGAGMGVETADFQISEEMKAFGGHILLPRNSDLISKLLQIQDGLKLIQN